MVSRFLWIRRAMWTVGLLLCWTTSPAELAGQQGYPDSSREIRHIVPWGAGAATDIAMRGFMRYVAQELGVPIYTENIAGGLSAVGLLHLQRAPADGYTIGTMTYDVLTVEQFRLVPLSWRDFRVLGMVTAHASALIVTEDRWRDLEAFLAEARTNPGRVRVGNAGTGGVWHQHALAMERELDVELLHVPYGSSSAQLAALLGGEVHAVVGSLPAVLPYVREGTLTVLGVMARNRDRLVPEAPTFVELGYEVEYASFRMVVAPKGLPDPIARELEAAVRRAWFDPAFQEWAQRAAISPEWKDAAEARIELERLNERVSELMDALGLVQRD